MLPLHEKPLLIKPFKKKAESVSLALRIPIIKSGALNVKMN